MCADLFFCRRLFSGFLIRCICSRNICCALCRCSDVAEPALFAAGIVIATACACKAELVHMPAVLMRPKAPRAGSRVLLERITPVWKRLSFLNKVTARNLFRYKSVFFMTVAGIMGCMALLPFGFAVRDSVTDLLPRQYENVCTGMMSWRRGHPTMTRFFLCKWGSECAKGAERADCHGEE